MPFTLSNRVPTRGPNNYPITSEACHPLTDQTYKWHNFHYKNGQLEFEKWLSETQNHRGRTDLSYCLVLAREFVEDNGVLPSDALYNLQKWLRGRQVCYWNILAKGEADDGHLHPIAIALELIRILKPKESEALIAGCTPSNLRLLVEDFGSAKAREIFAHARLPNQEKDVEICNNDSASEKHQRMSNQSWRRRPSTSSNKSSTERSRDSSPASSISSITSTSSTTSPSINKWSSSPASIYSYATAAASASSLSSTENVDPALTPPSTRTSKFVLKLKSTKSSSRST